MANDSRAAPLGSGPRAWNPSRWRVRTKVIAVVLVPVVLALALAAVNIRTQLGERSALQQVAAGTRLSGTVAELVDGLQIERSETAGFVATGRRLDRAPLDLAADRVDRSLDALRAAAPTVSGLDPGVRYRYEVALARLDGLEPLRVAAVATSFPATSVVTTYTSLIDPLLELSRDIAGAAGQTAVVRQATSLAALGRAKEQAEIQHALLVVGASTQSLSLSESESLRSAIAEQSAATDEFEAGSTPAQVQAFDDTVAGPEIDQRVRILQTALLRDAADQPLNVDPVAWERAAGTTRDALRAVETRLLGELGRTVDDLVDQAGTTALLAVVVVVLGVLLAVLIGVLIAASLVGPLRRLRYSALDVAERRLPDSIRRLEAGESADGSEGDGAAGPAGPPEPSGPAAPSPDRSGSDVEPVPIDTDEEVGEVARAFDTVHREAIRLAGEQARLRTNLNALFVNLSRRSQGLVERQLLLIDALEGREEDPDVLAELFQLDHLATRMRRNGENLLVLGGSRPARGSTEPVPVNDIIRAAIGEIENYQRIEVRPTPGVLVLGGPADDLTHLLAELLDNATTYSPPTTPVVVGVSRAPDSTLVLEVTDQGLGMDAEDLARANSRLEHAVLLDSSVPRQMGLFVVGALARRHGIIARLLVGDDGGITASVAVPPDLLVRPTPSGTGREIAPAAAAEAPPSDPLTDGKVVTNGTPLVDGRPVTDGLAVTDDGAAEESPIYQEMCSAWFREHAAGPTGEPVATGGAAQGPATATQDADGGMPAWSSGADEGWQAVAARGTGAPRDHTDVGLPRRRRGAELLPGRAAAGTEEVPAPRRAVDANTLRARMGSFQEGMRRGRSEVDVDGRAPTEDGADDPDPTGRPATGHNDQQPEGG